MVPGRIVRAVGEGVGLRGCGSTAAKRKASIRVTHVARASSRTARPGDRRCRRGTAEGVRQVSARAVVLGCGGFESNAAGARASSAGWGRAKVRGTRYNRARAADAAWNRRRPAGSGRVPRDADRRRGAALRRPRPGRQTNRLSYPYGVMVNREGDRFVDEGEDFQLYTYAKMGGIMRQPRRRRPADLRREGDAPARGALHDRHADPGRHARGLADQAARRPRSACRGRSTPNNAACGTARSTRRARRPGATRARAPQDELGAAARHGAVQRVSGDGRDHVHVRRRAHREDARLSRRRQPIEGLYAWGEMVGGLFTRTIRPARG